MFINFKIIFCLPYLQQPYFTEAFIKRHETSVVVFLMLPQGMLHKLISSILQRQVRNNTFLPSSCNTSFKTWRVNTALCHAHNETAVCVVTVYIWFITAYVNQHFDKGTRAMAINNR